MPACKTLSKHTVFIGPAQLYHREGIQWWSHDSNHCRRIIDRICYLSHNMTLQCRYRLPIIPVQWVGIADEVSPVLHHSSGVFLNCGLSQIVVLSPVHPSVKHCQAYRCHLPWRYDGWYRIQWWSSRSLLYVVVS